MRFLTLFFSLILVSCSIETPEQTELVILEEVDDNAYSFLDITTISSYDNLNISVNLTHNQFTRSEIDNIFYILRGVDFYVSERDISEYDYYISLSFEDQLVEVYFHGLIDDQVIICLVGDDGRVYESADFDIELIFYIYDNLAKSNIRLEKYEIIFEKDGYQLFTLISDLFRDYKYTDYNHELYIPVRTHPGKFREIELENGDKVYEVIEYSYTEYFTTRLKYYDVVYYFIYDGKVISLDEVDDIPIEIVVSAIDSVWQWDLFLHFIGLE